MLASYLGHFCHADHFRLGERICRRLPWLCLLFMFHKERFIPLWQPQSVTGYTSQQRFFKRVFPRAWIAIHRGCAWDWLEGDRAVPLFAANPRHQVSQIVVGQQGFLKGGLRRRCVEQIIFPPFPQTGVLLCV